MEWSGGGEMGEASLLAVIDLFIKADNFNFTPQTHLFLSKYP